MRVLIAGAGLGGLALAHKIQQENTEIEVIILERDLHNSSRHQGIVIGLRQEAIDVLIKLGLGSILDDLLTKHGPKDVALMNQNCQVLLHGKNWLRVKTEKQELTSSLLSRPHLRNEMAAKLKEGIIRWNSQVVNVTQTADSVEVELSDGSKISGDILVAADGARSHIRNLFAPKLIPDQLGLWNFAGTINQTQSAQFSSTTLFKNALQALVRANGRNGCSFLTFAFYPSPNELALLWSFSFPKEFVVNGLENPDTEEGQVLSELTKLARVNFDDENVSRFIAASTFYFKGYDMTSCNPKIFKSPETLFPNKTSRITFLGDAAHKTTTQAGLGATAAFQDAMDLGSTLIKTGFSVQMLREYEKRMCKRANTVVWASLGNTKRIHVKRGAISMAISNAFMRFIGGFIGFVQFIRNLGRLD